MLKLDWLKMGGSSPDLEGRARPGPAAAGNLSSVLGTTRRYRSMASRQEVLNHAAQLVGVVAILAAAFLLYEMDQRLKRAEALLASVDVLHDRIDKLTEQVKDAEAQARGADHSTMKFYERMGAVESKLESVERRLEFFTRP